MPETAPTLAEPLTFDVLDDLVLAHERRRATTIKVVPGPCLGSIVELHRFVQDKGPVLSFAETAETRAVQRCLETRLPVYLNAEATGFIPAQRKAYDGSDTRWDAFLFAMQKAMLAAGFPSLFARGICGALEEVEDNIHEHSQAVDTGVIAYRVSPDRVEWVVADRGIGILAGLQAGAFPSLSDSGEALKFALTDGRSRFGRTRRTPAFGSAAPPRPPPWRFTT